MNWYRWWHGSSTDPKFQMVAQECNIPLSCALGIWAVFLEKASESDPRGSFEIDHEVLSFQLGIDTVTPCNAMQRRGLLHVTDGVLHINSWEKRQPKRERDDNSNERVARYRSKQKQQVTDSEKDVTPCNANVTQVTPRLDKRRIDIYTPEFEVFWNIYPERTPPSNKQQAFKAWLSRLKEGVTPEEIITGAQNYADDCKKNGSVGSQFVKQASTFLGPNKHFLDFQKSAAAIKTLKHSGYSDPRDYT